MLRSIKSGQRKVRIIVLDIASNEIAAGSLDEFQLVQRKDANGNVIASKYDFKVPFGDAPHTLGAAAANAAVTATSIDLTSATDGTLVIIGSDLASSSRI